MDFNFSKSTNPCDVLERVRQFSPDINSEMLIRRVLELQSLDGFLWSNVVPAPDAPGLMILYGVLESAAGERVSFSGSGISVFCCLESGFGEASEMAALFSPPSGICPVSDGIGRQLLSESWCGTMQELCAGEKLVKVVSTTNRAGKWIPAAFFFASAYTDSTLINQLTLSSGIGSGEFETQAMMHGLLELVEHDALVDWWIVGTEARQFDFSQSGEIANYIKMIRHRKDGREIYLFLLNSLTGLPVVAAVSFDRFGEGFACGTACRLEVNLAAFAAIREMCQMEFGQHAVRTKIQQQGVEALSENDHSQIERAQKLKKHLLIRLLKEGECDKSGRTVASKDLQLSDRAGMNFKEKIPAHLNVHLYWYPQKSGRAVVCKVISPVLKPLIKTVGSVFYPPETRTHSPFCFFDGLMP